MFILSILERSVTDEKLAVILALAGAAYICFKKYQNHVNQAPNIEY